MKPEQTGPYVFICYSHDDTARVLPHIQFLQGDGIDVWYDRGIAAGSIWRRKIDEELEKATHLVFFVSHASLHSRHCEGEVHDALDHNKTVVPVFLEDAPLTPGMRVALSRVQALYGHRLSDDALNDQLRGAIRGAGSALPATAPSATANRRLRWKQQERFVWAAAVLAMVVTIGAGTWWWRDLHRVALPERSVAVLRFTTLSDEADIRHLADGLVEEVLNVLTEHRQLKVASRTASFAIPTDAGMAAIASALGVTYVLEGSVRPLGDGYRATAQLIRGRDGLHQWSHTFDFGRGSGEMEATALQIALRAFHYVNIDVELAGYRAETSNDEAFAYYEKAFRLYYAQDVEMTAALLEQVAHNTDKAIELDPAFAEPYRLRGRTALDAGEWRRWVERHLKLRPDSGLGYADLALIQLEEGDLAAADASLGRARALEPNQVLPWGTSAQLAIRRGRADEAIAFFKRATEINGANPGARLMYGDLLLIQKEYDEAESQYEVALRLDPNEVGAMTAQVLVAQLRGHEDEAKARFDAAWAKYGKTAPDRFILVLPGVGRAQDLRNLMKEWDAGTRPTNAGGRFWAHYALGEYAAAIDWLLRSVDEGTAPHWIRINTFCPEIREDPRFAEVLAKLDAKEITH